MNIGINNNINNRPNFGMAVLIDETAEPIIKKQVMKLSKKSYDKFFEKLDGAVSRQSENQNNIIIRRAKQRDALVAEVVDANADTAIKNYVTAQGLIHRNGSLRFLDKAEVQADKLAGINEKLDGYAKAEERHFYPGSIMPTEETV